MVQVAIKNFFYKFSLQLFFPHQRWIAHLVTRIVYNTRVIADANSNPHTHLFLIHIFLYSNWLRRFTRWISIFSPNTRKYGPDITPYFDTFYAVTAVKNYYFKIYHKMNKLDQHSVKCLFSKVDKSRWVKVW